ncbi:hypothetical protein [Ruegeria sp. TM1040]|uniref:hypothetical protein n=1 Tax=Ruegeria sp. (strain TM1040) TaxID=292414 RepID=UPI000046239C|nr:hypothetical protein [Ruegeria sp. TM1040]
MDFQVDLGQWGTTEAVLLLAAVAVVDHGLRKLDLEGYRNSRVMAGMGLARHPLRAVTDNHRVEVEARRLMMAGAATAAMVVFGYGVGNHEIRNH